MIVAIVRKSEEVFCQVDPITKALAFFEVLPDDTYRKLKYSQIAFSELDNETLTSTEILSITVTETDTQEEERLYDLGSVRLLDLITRVYEEVKNQCADLSKTRSLH